MKNEILRSLPRVDNLLEKDEIKKIIDIYGKENVKIALRSSLDTVRENVKKGIIEHSIEETDIIEDTKKKLEIKYRDHLKNIINGTGVIIHTNLGRAILSKEALEKIIKISSTYSNLEFNLEEGKRGSRYSHIEELLKELTGAESALVVNNNAAAVLLVLNEITKGKEVVVSRGELIEIGGSFRIPSVMEMAGTSLKEIGTTNRTHLRDYEEAIDSEKTGALIKIHSSNFKIIGYTKEVTSKELASLGVKYSIPTIEDLGSGAIIDLGKFGIEEKTVKSVIKDGIDIVTFSGDKLLGGPQAGIIVGKKKYIDKIKKNQLLRALRVDKFTLAALEETLKIYLCEEKAYSSIPVLNMISLDKDMLKINLSSIVDELNSIQNMKCTIELVEDYVGGGTLPTYKLEGYGIAIQLQNSKISNLEKYLRSYNPPIIGRIKDEKFIIHGRTLQKNELKIIKEAILAFN